MDITLLGSFYVYQIFTFIWRPCFYLNAIPYFLHLYKDGNKISRQTRQIIWRHIYKHTSSTFSQCSFSIETHLYMRYNKLFNYLTMNTTIHEGVFQKFKAKSFIILFKRTKRLARHVCKKNPHYHFIGVESLKLVV